MTTYECPVHKVEHTGTKREAFNEELHQALLNHPMSVTYKLYKQVTHGCHCPSNYKTFDTILAEAKAEPQPPQ